MNSVSAAESFIMWGGHCEPEAKRMDEGAGVQLVLPRWNSRVSAEQSRDPAVGSADTVHSETREPLLSHLSNLLPSLMILLF